MKKFYEDCVAIRQSECCCQYKCVCNRAKCADIGDATCPQGYERAIIDADICCPKAKCVKCAAISTASKVGVKTYIKTTKTILLLKYIKIKMY